MENDQDDPFGYKLPSHANALEQVEVRTSGQSPAGTTVLLRFTLSPDGGRLKSEAIDPYTGNSEEVEIRNRNALSQKYVEELREYLDNTDVD